ncbi:MAG: hypothetical protein Q7J40_01355 [Atribacterota bacterium]|nr:hypothetical protein [Atribacterota bacterium]
MNTEIKILFYLRLTLYRRMIKRWINKLKSLGFINLFYLALFIGFIVALYLSLPSYLEHFLEESNYPITMMVTMLLYAVFIYMVYNHFVKGSQYPPFYLPAGDVDLLLISPIDRKYIFGARLVKSYLSAGFGVGLIMLLSLPFLKILMPDLSLRYAVIGWIEIWMFLIILTNLQCIVFNSTVLKKVARVVRLIVRLSISALLFWTLYRFLVDPRFFQDFTPDLSTETFANLIDIPQTFLTLPILGVFVLLAFISILITFTTITKMKIEPLIEFSLFISETINLFYSGDWEGLEILSEQSKKKKGKKIWITVPGYGFGTFAITWKAASTLVKQIGLWLIYLGMLFACLLSSIYIQTSWIRLAIMVYCFFSIGTQLLNPFQHDLRKPDFVRSLPLLPKEIIEGNVLVSGISLCVLGWFLVSILWLRYSFGALEYFFLMSFVPVGSYLIIICGVMSILCYMSFLKMPGFIRKISANALAYLIIGPLILIPWFLYTHKLPFVFVWLSAISFGIFEGLILKRWLIHWIERKGLPKNE